MLYQVLIHPHSVVSFNVIGYMLISKLKACMKEVETRITDGRYDRSYNEYYNLMIISSITTSMPSFPVKPLKMLKVRANRRQK